MSHSSLRLIKLNFIILSAFIIAFSYSAVTPVCKESYQFSQSDYIKYAGQRNLDGTIWFTAYSNIRGIRVLGLVDNDGSVYIYDFPPNYSP